MVVTILNYISVNSSSTPISQNPTPPSSSTQAQNPKQTRLILPKEKPLKWSTGVAPGEYGGPPTTTKLRKYWGGEKDDPITSDDFIWNRDFMGRMKRLIDDTPDSQLQSPSPKEKPSGFLSLNRSMRLDSVEVDLSKELTEPSKRVLEQQAEAARRSLLASESQKTAAPRWKLAPTRREQEKWDRAAKSATGGTDAMLRETKKPRGDPKILAAEARERYLKLKRKLQNLTLGVGGIGIVSAYFSYSPEIAASFGAGFIGSLVYIRMLGNSVDSMAGGARGILKGAISQPRLLVPVALVMIYNRWNGIVVPEYGLMHLDLIPMLLGFFTYKIATFTQAIEEAVSIVKEKPEV
ncbi:hypothetical protein IFM89_031829 [Coptis chinensis]|uniref:CGL160/ATPI domain-containing protein n=1 Tax=Coptis chinensis TaxID=261450 RepID=A0A835GZ95_9MAGN|nr:hypothetical protein IFM89_031829 [Coptis chinensis]